MMVVGKGMREWKEWKTGEVQQFKFNRGVLRM